MFYQRKTFLKKSANDKKAQTNMYRRNKLHPLLSVIKGDIPGKNNFFKFLSVLFDSFLTTNNHKAVF